MEPTANNGTFPAATGPPFARGTLEVGLSAGGGLRWAVTDLTAVMEEARHRLDLSPVAAAALGRGMAGAALLLRLSSKTPQRLGLEIRGDGPLRRVIAEADDRGNLRGMVAVPRVELPPAPGAKLPVGQAVGRGMLRVLREYGGGGTYSSQVELVSGEIGKDLAHFLIQSEQTRSAVLLGVLARPTGVAAAGGTIIEAMPEAEEEALRRLERNIAGLGGVSRVLEEAGLAGMMERLLAGLGQEVVERCELSYRCRCSRDRLLHHLVLLSRDELEELLRVDGSLVADCVFCGTAYRFTAGELEPS